MKLNSKLLTLILIFVSILFNNLKAQSYKDMMSNGKYTVKNIQEAAEEYFNKIGKGKGTGYKQFKRWEYNALRNQNEQGYLNGTSFYYNEFLKAKANPASSSSSSSTTISNPWENLGPTYFNATSGWNPGVGRITSIAIDKNNSNIMIVGGMSGGVWKTTDNGSNWTVLTDNMPSLKVYSLTIDPTNSLIYYWGSSNAIFKSTDGGLTWNLLSNGVSGSITEILIDPTNNNNLYSTSSSGIYKSVNAGSSWSRIGTGRGYDIKYKPNDNNTMYAAGSKFYKSTNGGTSFTEITGFSTGPKMIGISADNPSVVYVLEASGRVFGALYKSIDSGTTFTKLTHTKNYFGYASNGSDTRGQAPRDMDIVVNPNNVDEVHIAGINTWRSTDGGVNFSITSQWNISTASSENLGYCHADVDILIYKNSKLYAGTDGGIFVANNPAATISNNYYTDLTNGIGIRQFYKIGVSQTNPEIVTGGSQDNGTSVYTNTGNWKDWLGADGMESFVDKDNSDYLYGTSQYGSLYVSINGGNTRSGLSKPDNKTGNWVTPFEQDPTTSNILYTGYDQVYRGTFSLLFGFFPQVAWTAISQDFGANLNHLKIAQSNNNIMYAAEGSNLYKTIDGGATNWASITGFSGNINSIAIHPTNPNKIAIATTSSQKIYISKDGGSSWVSQLNDLPNFSALSLVWQNHIYRDVLYLGMNFGVYYLIDGETNWATYSTDLPNVQIGELDINFTNNKIYAGTYGRGLWKADLITPPLINDSNVLVSTTSDTLSFSQLPSGTTLVTYYNSSGNVVGTENITGSSVSISITNLPIGVYVIKFETSDGTVVHQELHVKL